MSSQSYHRHPDRSASLRGAVARQAGRHRGRFALFGLLAGLAGATPGRAQPGVETFERLGRVQQAVAGFRARETALLATCKDTGPGTVARCLMADASYRTLRDELDQARIGFARWMFDRHSERRLEEIDFQLAALFLLEEQHPDLVPASYFRCGLSCLTPALPGTSLLVAPGVARLTGLYFFRPDGSGGGAGRPDRLVMEVSFQRQGDQYVWISGRRPAPAPAGVDLLGHAALWTEVSQLGATWSLLSAEGRTARIGELVTRAGSSREFFPATVLTSLEEAKRLLEAGDAPGALAQLDGADPAMVDTLVLPVNLTARYRELLARWGQVADPLDRLVHIFHERALVAAWKASHEGGTPLATALDIAGTRLPGVADLARRDPDRALALLTGITTDVESALGGP